MIAITSNIICAGHQNASRSRDHECRTYSSLCSDIYSASYLRALPEHGPRQRDHLQCFPETQQSKVKQCFPASQQSKVKAASAILVTLDCIRDQSSK